MSDIVEGDTRVPHKALMISSTPRTEIPNPALGNFHATTSSAVASSTFAVLRFNGGPEFRWRLHRQAGRFLTAQDAIK